MTTKQLKEIMRLLKNLYAEIQKQALIEGISLTSPEYQMLIEKARERFIMDKGFTIAQYEKAKEDLLLEKENHKQKILQTTEETQNLLKQILEESKKKEEYQVSIAPEDRLKLRGEKGETIIGPKGDQGLPGIPGKDGRTPTEKELLDLIKPLIPSIEDNNLREEISKLAKRMDEIKIPNPLNIEKLKEELLSDFQKNFKHNIDMAGMPDFRKLALGLQQQIDAKTDTGITQLTGDATAGPGSGSQAVTLANTAVTAGSYGSVTSIPSFTVDGKGRLTAASGNTIPALASGTYTPTRSAEVNMDANVSTTSAQYLRVGNTVTVSGRFTANPTLTATVTSFEITLPIASDIANVQEVAGTAFSGAIAGMGAEINGSIANNTAVISWISSDIASQTWSYIFTYLIS